MAACWSCEGDLGPLRKVSRDELCAGCQTWIHCCKNCRFWSTSARSCEEPAADWVHDRERSNFCDFFALPTDDEPPRAGGEPGADTDHGRDAFDALFKK